MTPNVAGAHEFYSTTLGWKTQAGEQDPSYQMFAAPSGPLGAAVETRTGAPQWVPYIGTIDVDATTAAATGLGGRVAVPAADISNAGRYALLADPHGATFGVHSSAAEPDPDTLPHYGQFSWHELATTTDPKSAFAFYAALFGWEEMSQFDMGPMGMYLIFGRNGTQLGGMFNKSDMGKSGPAYWVGYVRVKNVDATLKKVVAARGALLTGPMEVPGGDRIAQFMDPYGAFFAAPRP
jgi:predicted enzyme related to lactoylglutathione lyase